MSNVNFAKWVRMKGRGANARIHKLRTNGEFPWLERPPFVWECEIAVGDFTGAGATSQELDLDALYGTRFPFINEVFLEPGAHLVLLTAFSGGAVSACTAELGDTGDPNGLVTASNVFTGATANAPIVTASAAEYALRSESGYLPTLTLRTTTANVSALTAGRLLARIPFTPWRET
jgi:hypothetical protein